MNRVWIYIISKELSAEQLQRLERLGQEFVNGWTAHDTRLSGSFEIFSERIIIVRVNEDINAASGCSIDKLTRFIRQMEAEFGIELLNRMLVAIKVVSGVQIVHAAKVADLLREKFLNENSIVYNTSASNEQELKNWELALKETWLKKYLG